jgi:hypothetical protein
MRDAKVDKYVTLSSGSRVCEDRGKEEEEEAEAAAAEDEV